jgi:cytochrome d ubiquinol oxidase subunit I
MMVGLGVFHIFLLIGSLFVDFRGQLESRPWVLKTLCLGVVSATVANQAGWIAAEIGRQPWTVYGLLRTSDSLSKSVTSGQVMGSLIGFGLIYLLLFGVWVYVMAEKINHGPEEAKS